MKSRVLVVDDETQILEAFRLRFQDQYDIHCAIDAWEGLEILENEGPFAVVVSDWKMPKIGGIGFLGEVMRRSPETARIMLTGFGEQRLAVEAVNTDYLFRFHTKPCPSPELKRSIDDGIAWHRRLMAA